MYIQKPFRILFKEPVLTSLITGLHVQVQSKT